MFTVCQETLQLVQRRLQNSRIPIQSTWMWHVTTKYACPLLTYTRVRQPRTQPRSQGTFWGSTLGPRLPRTQAQMAKNKHTTVFLYRSVAKLSERAGVLGVDATGERSAWQKMVDFWQNCVDFWHRPKLKKVYLSAKHTDSIHEWRSCICNDIDPSRTSSKILKKCIFDV